MAFHIPTDMFVTIITAVFASGGFWSYLQSKDVLNKNRRAEDEKFRSEMLNSIKLLKEADMYILRRDLLMRTGKLLDMDSDDMVLTDYENIQKEYRVYHALGGNSDVETRMELLKDKVGNNFAS